MAYLSPALSNLVAIIKKSATGIARDFNEIEQLQSSIRDYRGFIVASYDKIEHSLVSDIRTMYPNYPVLGFQDRAKEDTYLCISPIDGITNFAHGISDFAISVAAVEKGVPVMGVVYAPVNDELYFAEKGKGAFKEGFRNHERLRVSARKDFVNAVVAVAHPDAKIIDKLTKAIGHIRISGSSALDFAHLAAGKLDCVVSAKAAYNDIAAGLLLVKEAGGSIFDAEQRDARSEDLAKALKAETIIATNFELNQKFFMLMK